MECPPAALAGLHLLIFSSLPVTPLLPWVRSLPLSSHHSFEHRSLFKSYVCFVSLRDLSWVKRNELKLGVFLSVLIISSMLVAL